MAIVNTNKLEVTKLDFHGIRDSLKTFLQGQTEFNDYDFDGSGLGAILDLLSYNTHYLAFYLNMVANEMYLDTASQRSSVVGIARQLGYTPKSARGAIAAVNLTLTASGGAASVTIPRWTPFSIVVEKDKFLFYTVEPKTVNTVSNAAAFVKLPIKEGIYVKNTWTYNSQGKKQRFILDNQYIDTTTMIVTVKASKSTGTTDTYTLYKDLIALDSTSQVYFLQEVEDGKYEIYFGDGIYGKALSDENVITVEYLTTNGSIANFAGRNSIEQFSLLTTINDSNSSATTVGNITIIGNGYAAGGTLPESVSSIKFNAPLSYAAQDRAVTANDYKNILLSNYGNIRGVKVWGGRPKIGMKYSGLQENSGTVYICILPKHGDFLPRATKDYVLKSILAPYKILGIKNEIVDPKFIKLLVSLEVIYNPTISALPEANIQKKIINSVKRYGMTDLEVFDGKFRHSILTSIVSDADPSIVAIKRMIVKFKIDSRFDYSLVQSREPSYGVDEFAPETSWDKVVFPNVDYGLSIQPSNQGGGIRTNTFYVWARSLSNWSGKLSIQDIPENIWMKGADLFAWSMKRTDAGGTTQAEIHAGKFLECYFKDDGNGRINLYSVGENGDIKIPYSHMQGAYENSPDLSWIEGQASVIGWDVVVDSVKDPRVRLSNRVNDKNEILSWVNPKVLDYESWGSVNYSLGRITSLKPIAILAIAGDVEFYLSGEIPAIDYDSYWGAETVFRGIKLTRDIQSLEWFAFQYTGQDVGLGGYTAAGQNVMRLDPTYLTNNMTLYTTSDKPSLQIGTRKSTTISTEEVVKHVDSTTSKKVQPAGGTSSAVQNNETIISGGDVDSSGSSLPLASTCTTSSTCDTSCVRTDEDLELEYEQDSTYAYIDPLKPGWFKRVVVDPDGVTWSIETDTKEMTDNLAGVMETMGKSYITGGGIILPAAFYITKIPGPTPGAGSGAGSSTNLTIVASNSTNSRVTTVLDAAKVRTITANDGQLINLGGSTDDGVSASLSCSTCTISTTLTIDNTNVLDLKIDSDFSPSKDENPVTSNADVAETIVVKRIPRVPDAEEREYMQWLDDNWVWHPELGDYGEWTLDKGTDQDTDGSVILPTTTTTSSGCSTSCSTGCEVRNIAVSCAGGALSAENSNDTGNYPPNFDYDQAISLGSLGGITANGIAGTNLGRWDLNNDNLIDVYDMVKYVDIFNSTCSRAAFQTKMGQEQGRVYEGDEGLWK